MSWLLKTTVAAAVLLALSGRAMADAGSCPAQNPLPVGPELQRQLALLAAQDMGGFCSQVINDRLKQQDIGHVFHDPPDLREDTPIVYAKVPGKHARELALRLVLGRLLRNDKGDLSRAENETKDLLNGGTHRPPSSEDYADFGIGNTGILHAKSFAYIKKFSHDTSGVKVSSPVLTTVCLSLRSSNAKQCAQAMQNAIEDMSVSTLNPQVGTSKFALLNETQELIENPQYANGLRKAATLMLDRAQAKSHEDADLFSDFKNSFMESGMSDRDATEATWKSIAVASIAGVDLVLRLEELKIAPENWPAAESLAVIAGAIPLLDAEYADSGHLYSYPKGVTSSCDTGKSYHFWVSAYLARRRVQEGSSPAAAAEAVFALEVGYRLFIDDLRSALYESNSFSPVTHLLRADFSTAAAGAAYGSQSTTGGWTGSIDSLVRGSIAKAPIVSGAPLEEKLAIHLPQLAVYPRLINEVDPAQIFHAAVGN